MYRQSVARIFFASLLVASAGVGSSVKAQERMEVCAKMQEAYGSYSTSYHVNALVTNGQDLAAKTNDYSDYVMYATYVVIFWSQNQASVIKMQYPTLGPFPQDGVDQEGRTWQINQFSGYCI